METINAKAEIIYTYGYAKEIRGVEYLSISIYQVRRMINDGYYLNKWENDLVILENYFTRNLSEIITVDLKYMGRENDG